MASATRTPGTARWMSNWLVAAGVYNLVWGAAVVAFPFALFDALQLDRPIYPGIWQCVGMIVGVYGVGYLVAAGDPLRHWPIVLVGLLGKLLGPIGFVLAVWSGELPLAFGVTILTNDLLWWPAFALILVRAYNAARVAAVAGAPSLRAALRTARDQHGRTLLALSEAAPALVVFLRHAGCTFCREALEGLRRARPRIEAGGTRIVLVHMSSEPRAAALFGRFDLAELSRVGDGPRELYRAFGLPRGRLGQLLGPVVWWRGARAFFRGCGIGLLDGDGLQMPGVFLVHRGEIVRAHRHRTVADQPDYVALSAAADIGAGGAPAVVT